MTAVVLREEQLRTWPGRKGFKTLYLATLVVPVTEGGNRNVEMIVRNPAAKKFLHFTAYEHRTPSHSQLRFYDDSL